MSATLTSLTETEFMLVRDTMPTALNQLDEDGLVELHTRVRRARNKYSKLYRRQASAKVEDFGGRGKARPKNTRNMQKAEVFEEALARVSRGLAVAARKSANELKTQRLQAVRSQRNMAPPTPSRRPRTNVGGPQRSQPVPAAEPANRKQHTATKAVGARRQAKRDSR